MKLRTKIGVAFGTVAVGLLAMASVAFACLPGTHGGRACGVCGGIAGTVQASAAFGAGGRSAEVVALATALGVGGFVLFVGGIGVLARAGRRDSVPVAVRTN